jgi:hypothetical protein
MAQTGYTPIQLYYSSTTTNAPLAANLASGELAINITDGKLFYKDNANAVQVIAWKVTPTTAGGTGLTSYTAGDLTYYASGTTFTKLAIGTADYVLTSSGTAPQWSASLKAKAGGTGQTSYAVGDLLYADTTTTLAKLADVATGNALISGGVSTAPSWGKIGLTTHVSGTLPVANGGTGVTTSTGTTNVVLSGSPTLVTPKGVQGSVTLGPSLGTDSKSGGTFMGFASWNQDVTVVGIDYQYIQGAQDNTVEAIQYKVGGASAVAFATYTGTAAGTRSGTYTASISVTAGTRFYVGVTSTNNGNQTNCNYVVWYVTA